MEIRVSGDIFSSEIDSLSVSVWSVDSSGHPASSLHTLTNPASVEDTVGTFTAPAGATLQAGTTYVLVASFDVDLNISQSPRWAGLDEIKNRGRFGGHPIVRHGDGVRQRRLVSHHLDALHEVADERLALGERPILQEVPEVRNVLRYLLGVGKGNPALLKPSLGVVSRSLKLLLTVPQREDAGDRTSNVSSLVSRAS